MSSLFHHLSSCEITNWQNNAENVMPAVLFMFSSHLLSFPIAFGGFAMIRPFMLADDFVQPINWQNWDGPQDLQFRSPHIKRTTSHTLSLSCNLQILNGSYRVAFHSVRIGGA